ncbi:trace amine-associated receptor 1-like isoform X2 [Brienomyrus brachyistius]|uniref:trace amine-associated receptor 1-like isoform X2 n=1 Tax=Brienomyrus brachyistius TaxID=42636 RepID=UPI0020B3E2C6|nr:trace amine-associated receptor 1-like isoform X2 [Brienomyrus brachyistius]XP_048842024.1 trace amine-associated receptor 1-like isoform X2 [Brienomyrus brachyistius]XP_048842027.1 trace amine-associated receptor 1-like isoform X2 [Brienomyrus brachyistius]XP_048842030.1 trace amine-associated receptor 1-like isoform X2 [Brienomyrus brachyistius]XP_048842031.1 trace amine-associated receptor 1-like isoform X2 [Brienomyrus brachyistius]XP_048842032.1 trace amine-associated receptor 1-like i
MKTNHSGTENIHYCFESSNTSCLKYVYPTTIRASLYVLLGATVLLTVLGNLLVIVTISHSKQLHTPTNYLILSLAVSDFLLGAVVMPPSLIRSLETCWYLGDWFCKIHTSIEILLTAASIFMLYLISVERYVAVSQPLLYHALITTRVAKYMILTCWVLSALVSFGMELHSLKIQDVYLTQFSCEGRCAVLLDKASSILSSLFIFFIPGLFMLGLYLKILVIAHKQARSIQVTILINRNHEKTKTILSKMEQKSTRTLGIVTAVFLSCWSPCFIYLIIDPVTGLSTPYLYDILIWICYLNSVMNPIIYSFLFKWFRESLRKAFSKILNSFD